MRERITFLTPDVSDDSSGGYTNADYIDVYSCWADVNLDNSTRDYDNFQLKNMVAVNIKYRYNPDFTPTIINKIVWRDKLLSIHSAPDLGEKNYINLKCYYDPAEDYE